MNDSSGNDRTGAHSGTNKYENLGSIGKFGNGLYLDGTGEHISITGYKGITGGAARTMAAWIKTDFSKAPILNWGNNAAGQKWTFRVQTDAGVSGAHRIEVNGGSIVGDTAVNDNRWHHVVAVMSGSNVNTITLYVDGVAVGNSSGPSNRTVATASGIDVRIGTDHSSRHFRGFMDAFVFIRLLFLPRKWRRFMAMDWGILVMPDRLLPGLRVWQDHRAVILLISRPAVRLPMLLVLPHPMSMLPEVPFPILPQFPVASTPLRLPLKASFRRHHPCS